MAEVKKMSNNTFFRGYREVGNVKCRNYLGKHFGSYNKSYQMIHQLYF